MRFATAERDRRASVQVDGKSNIEIGEFVFSVTYMTKPAFAGDGVRGLFRRTGERDVVLMLAHVIDISSVIDLAQFYRQ